MNAVAAAICNLTVTEAMELAQSLFDRRPPDDSISALDATAIAWWLTDWASAMREGEEAGAPDA